MMSCSLNNINKEKNGSIITRELSLDELNCLMISFEIKFGVAHGLTAAEIDRNIEEGKKRNSEIIERNIRNAGKSEEEIYK